MIFIIMWLAALGLSFIISLGILVIQYKMFIDSPQAQLLTEIPSFIEFFAMRMVQIAEWIARDYHHSKTS